MYGHVKLFETKYIVCMCVLAFFFLKKKNNFISKQSIFTNIIVIKFPKLYIQKNNWLSSKIMEMCILDF